ncbi:orotate phosphoribosyltransferase [Methanolinea mesophila]|uniref:orotate phosphoribosyltransferase n=1 Tax=Methanolinea mesophila TaxID=547055 RepID=UPI001AE4F670|nr:orotate phosphoribosyltransferase [Methanolinea mesophila]MBP1928037.1 orotate phosphoribosyltransferase [Methanolinea mesophila]
MVTRIAELLKSHGAVEFGDFVLASGKKSTYYMDIKSALTNPVVLRAIGKAMADTAAFDTVAGVAVGGVPLAVAVSLISGKPFAIIRSSGKDHGKSGTIIGNVEGKRVLLVEDVTTSGGSALYGVRELRKAGALVDIIVTVVDRQEGAPEMLAGENLTLIPLCTAQELLSA